MNERQCNEQKQRCRYEKWYGDHRWTGPLVNGAVRGHGTIDRKRHTGTLARILRRRLVPRPEVERVDWTTDAARGRNR
jgi:hypothetical protein